MTNKARFEADGEYEVLKGEGNSGDFVLNHQVTADNEGFSHVAKTWYNKTVSYDEAMEKLQTGVDNREDIVANCDEMKPAINNGEIVFKHEDGRIFRPTDWA